MATVYLADDLKHERKVALKVLKPELAAVVGAERFLAEIKTTANLQHPHILPLHDSGEADGFLYYVMPYVEGETLRERIDREKQLPVEEAMRITSDLAEALDHAHRHGVVHKDIKPANVLLSDGRPLIADFGIALAVAQAGGGRVTETGLSVGTPHYMSPEQATGDRDVDPRTDVYALGCVLYEMLTGEPPYQGTTAQAVLAKILTDPAPAPGKVRGSIRPNVDAAIRKALEKLPADRFTGAQEFARALSDPGFRHGDGALAGVAVGGGPWNRLTVAFAGVAALFALAFGWSLLRPAPPLPVERFVGPFGNGQGPISIRSGRFNLSPDGSLLVYSGLSEGGSGEQLWVRRWDNLEPSPIRGTEGGRAPVVSPDGEEVAFRESGEIKVVSLQGGPVRTLTTGSQPHWGTNGYIYATSASKLFRVPATGGPPEPVTATGDGVRYFFTDILPGAAVALLNVDMGDGTWDVRALRLETGEMKGLVPGGPNVGFARYADSGHLVYIAPDRTLMAARFDPEAMELLGPSVALEEGVVAFSISDTGKLFYSKAGARVSELVWVTRSAEVTPVSPGETLRWPIGNQNLGLRLSPNGTRVAFVNESGGDTDIWTKELPDGPMSRLTFDERIEQNLAWTPDGQGITFSSEQTSASGPLGTWCCLWTVPANGTGEAEFVYGSADFHAGDGVWSPDGKWLVMRRNNSANVSITHDLFALQPGVDSVAKPMVATRQFREMYPAISHDGRWLAYESDETGNREVFVRPFPNVEDGKWRVSTGGGTQPVWAHNGRELFFVNPVKEELVAAPFAVSGTAFEPGPVTSLFSVTEFVPIGSTVTGDRFYDVSLDDERFLMTREVGEGAAATYITSTVLVQNFFEELKARVPN